MLHKATHRIASIDIVRGAVMVIMALDHTREFFHHNSLIGQDPLDLKTTYPLLFFTRWITHYCAPVFVFLSGTSVYLYAQRNKTKKEVALFLFTRGLWLVVAEYVVINGLWFFNLSHLLLLQVFWAIGMSMICLSGIQFLPYKMVLATGLLIVFGHNLLDGVQINHPQTAVVIWSLIHVPKLFQPSPHFFVLVGYPFLPWLGLMLCGYGLGKLYTSHQNSLYRKRFLFTGGIVIILLFIIIRFINVYGDRNLWTSQQTSFYTFLSFINTTKYPPSLLYMLMTIGPAFIALAVSENASNWFSKRMIVYGKVPFMYYILHVLLLHSLARLFMLVSGRGSGDALFPGFSMIPDSGYPLWVVYVVWISVVILLYYPCKWYGNYRSNHPEKKWLSYL